MIKLNIFTFYSNFFILSLIYQLKNLIKKTRRLLNAFKFNNISGLILFLGICSIKFINEISRT